MCCSGNYGAFVDINQSYTNPYPSDGYNELVAIIRKLRAGDLSSIELGTEITIPVCKYIDLSYNCMNVNVGYSPGYSEEFWRFEQYDTTKNMYKWSHKKTNGGYDYYYTREYSFGGRTTIYKESSGEIVPTGHASKLNATSAIKDVKIILTGIDVDTPSSGNYLHTARFEFLSKLGNEPRIYPDNSGYHSYAEDGFSTYLNSSLKDGFLRRIPVDIRNLFIPVTIECAYRPEAFAADATVTLENQKCFLPSKKEVSKSANQMSYYYDDGSGTTSDINARLNTKRQRLTVWTPGNGWFLRDVYQGSAACVNDDGTIGESYGLTSSSPQFAPAFVIG